MKNRYSRRDFLKIFGFTTFGIYLTACGIRDDQIIKPTITELISTITSTKTSTSTQTSTATNTVTNTPTEKPTSTITSTPKPPTIGDLGRKLGMDIGIGIKLNHRSSFNDKKYVDAILNFSMVEDGQAANPRFSEKDGGRRAFEYLNMLSEFAEQNSMSFSLNHLFWEGYFKNESSPIYYLLNSPDDEIVSWMENRVKRFFEIPYFTAVNFANEAMNSDWKSKQPVWNSRPSPMYKVYKEEWPEKAYRLAYDEAERTGRKVGEDISLIYNAAGLEYETSRSRYEYNYLIKLREKLSEEYKINNPFDFGLQFHVRLNRDHSICGGDGPQMKDLDKETLIERFKMFSDVGEIRITEFGICGTDDVEVQKTVLRNVVEAAIESNVVKSILFWDVFTPIDLRATREQLQWSIHHLFDAEYKPGFMFVELQNILNSYI